MQNPGRFKVTASTGAVPPIGFQGDWTDPVSGLVDMGARWYSPVMGGFVSRDSYSGRLDTPVSLNRYTYANANPLAFADPTGRYSADSLAHYAEKARQSMASQKPRYASTPAQSAAGLKRGSLSGSADTMARQASIAAAAQAKTAQDKLISSQLRAMTVNQPTPKPEPAAPVAPLPRPGLAPSTAPSAGGGSRDDQACSPNKPISYVLCFPLQGNDPGPSGVTTGGRSGSLQCSSSGGSGSAMASAGPQVSFTLGVWGDLDGGGLLGVGGSYCLASPPDLDVRPPVRVGGTAPPGARASSGSAGFEELIALALAAAGAAVEGMIEGDDQPEPQPASSGAGSRQPPRGTRPCATNTASLADDAAGSYGPFHRLESPTQTPATAALQEANGEMWGATARGGLNPTVKAYQGPLPPGARGVEFTTPVRPSDVGLGRPGDIAIWRRGAPCVVDVNDDYVKIACTVVRNTQC